MSLPNLIVRQALVVLYTPCDYSGSAGLNASDI